MYLQHFGLRTSPFEMAPNADLLYMTAQHREALAGISYAIVGRKGIAVMTGDAGTGKTTILTRTLQHLPPGRVRACTILNPLLTAREFLEMVLLALGEEAVPESKTLRLQRLEQILGAAHRDGVIATLVIDEAHLLSPDLLEEIRLFGNYEADGQKLLQIVLAGQPPLSAMLNRADLFQFKQRVAVRVTLHPLTGGEVEKYMRFRWTRAGGPQALPFAPDAVARVAEASGGIPRLINTICDNALLAAMGASVPLVTAAHVAAACADLDLLQASEPALAPPAPAAEPAAKPASPPAQRPVPDALAMPTLARYAPAGTARESLLTRWAGKLGLAG